MPSSRDNSRSWWKEAIVYQIYPASFLDSNSDGLGDLPGIISKLDYIKSVGANAVWLSPIFKSPQKDMGYDVADYREIHQPYGSLQDAEALIQGCHERGIKVLLDLVVNHTSDQHPWFQESRSSRTSPKRDWYIWRDPKTDANGARKPPNNWASIFGGSAWTWDEVTGQYYLSLFLPSQPDLNWPNENMRRATHADMVFWLDRGVDGFRIDSMNLMSKHPDLPDAPITRPDSEFQPGDLYFASGPRMHEYIKEMRTEVFDKYDCMTVGELGFTKDETSVSEYVARDRHELNMVFTGDIVDMDFGPDGKYQRNDFRVSRLRDITTRWQSAMPKFDGWNAVYLDNHDSGRSLSRYASDLPQHRDTAAKMLATYLGSLSGTLFLLQGQEIGMANASREWGIEDYIDVEGRNYYDSVLKQRGEGADMQDVLRELRLKSRDNGRLPMQWSSETNAGFTKAGKPWMRVNDDFKEWNVETQEGKENSVLAYWRQVLALRKKEKDVFIYGRYNILEVARTGEDIFAYTMTSVDGAKTALVILNFSDQTQRFDGTGYEGWTKLLGVNAATKVESRGVELIPYEGVIFCNW
ncbi:family 13 glycoside hydrolase [Coniochaeta sp. PMI_546]|nr:family 13 glycoside hydrolase [Coniochaeta sp. PMI_546]